MMNILLNEQVLKEIRIDDMRTYLQQKGWKHIPYPDTRMEIFAWRDRDGENALLRLPASTRLSDFYPRLADALSILAEVEQTPLITLLQTLQSVGNDVMRLRLLLPEGQHPSITLAAEFLQKFYELLLFAAHMEVVGRNYYFRRSSETGQQEARQFQLGHTFQGSFGFCIASPIVQQTIFTENAKAGRRIVERITRGLITAEKAEKEQNSSIISNRYTEGLNGNMCYAAARMLESLRDTQVEYSVDWSPRLKAPQDVSSLPVISLNSKSAVYLQQAGNLLKEKAESGTEELGERDIHGDVKELKDEGERRYIIIDSINYQRSIEAEIEQADDYKMAANAHADRRPITIRGTLLRKKGGRLRLINARDVLVR